MKKKNELYVFFLGFNKTAELLIQNGANVNFVGSNGDTALNHAAFNGEIILQFN